MIIPDLNKLSKKAKTESYVKKYYPDFYNFLIEEYRDKFDISFIECIYLYEHQLDGPGKCVVCGAPTKFENGQKGYRACCSLKCSNSNPLKKDLTKKIMLEKYGIENPSQMQEVKEKKKQTMIDNWGVEYPSQSKDIREKAKKTMLERYGVEYSGNSKELQEKAKNTCLEKYGVEYQIGSKSTRDKIKQTKQIRYGDENYTNREKWHNTCIEKYGVNSTFELKEIQEKAKQTCLERYGTENPSQTHEVKEKKKQTMIDKWGVENPGQSEKIREKVKQTMIERYGIPNYNNYEKIKSTKQVKYNDEYFNNRDKSKQTCLERYGVEYISQLEEVQKKVENTNLERYGVTHKIFLPTYRNNAKYSKPNQKFAKMLDNLGIYYEREYVIENRIYDFKVGSVLVEINPFATHNSTWGYRGRDPKTQTYHQDKSNLALDNGFECIHIWDWDDMNKIVKMLKNKQSVGARKCVIREIDKKTCNEFLVNNHLQGKCKGQKVMLGLYYEDALVEAMVFGKPRYNKKYEWELLRLCSDSNYMIVGGSKKLFKYFIDNFNPQSVISYCDNSKFSGKIYLDLGFKKSKNTRPSRHWYHPKYKLHITDNLLRQRGFDQLFGTDFGKGTSNEQLMLEYGFIEIYDSGQSTFGWNCDMNSSHRLL